MGKSFALNQFAVKIKLKSVFHWIIIKNMLCWSKGGIFLFLKDKSFDLSSGFYIAWVKGKEIELFFVLRIIFPITRKCVCVCVYGLGLGKNTECWFTGCVITKKKKLVFVVVSNCRIYSANQSINQNIIWSFNSSTNNTKYSSPRGCTFTIFPVLWLLSTQHWSSFA